ncbi:polysaccharide biosynthesis/export family protein [Cellulophaga sp. Hel_I_12]|uniref:polysaccharide biosynthesis/export family protein n=1 Tax=Cellulophaga sp. Hel_I_12 TaxID=1249972 RepID=UPI0006479772|nr:polysaccharide biosynthesis/export family protein [Cellulophaga sp. Hel_I_12]
MKISNKILLLVFSIAFLSSCGSRKDIVYFQDTSNFETLVDDNAFEPKFKIDDEVSILISTTNPEASIPFNLFRGVAESGGTPDQVSYLVDKYGEIDFPVLGKVKVAGLSPDELRTLLRSKLEGTYLNDPIINIRLKNFRVTVLGAVNRPGTYLVLGERVTILEALGLAGDLNIQGKRQNIMVLRDFNGTKVTRRIDITSKEAFKNPMFYLTQNDVVYVEPSKSAIKTSSLDQRVTIGLSLVTFAITSVLLLTR